MKTLNENFKRRKMQIMILVIFLLLFVAIGIVAIISNNRTMAAFVPTICPGCGGSISGAIGSKDGHRFVCGDCGEETDETYAHDSNPCTICAYCVHTGGTHENGGICTVCNKQYQTHSIDSSKIAGGKDIGGAHQVLYACTAEGCTKTYEGGYESHKGETHENGGVCTVCGVQYKTHTISQEIRSNNNGTHTYYRVCTCEYSYAQGTGNCNTANDGACSYCGYKEDNSGEESETGGGTGGTTTCTHEYETENDATNHWEVCEKCNQEKANSRQAHTYGDYIDLEDGTHNRICSVCNYTETAAEHTYEQGTCSACGAKEPCTHEYKTDKDATNHWEVCKKCNEEKANSRQAHTYGAYTDLEDGTHNRTCIECNYAETAVAHNYGNYTNVDETNHKRACEACGKEETSTHTYENGVCECGAKEPCTHEYKTDKDATNHWEVCKKCNEEKANSRQAHTYGAYADLEDGTHNRICSVCNYAETAVAHTYGNYTNVNTTNHKRTCEACGKEEIAVHIYENGVCVCGANEQVQDTPCEHEYEYAKNATNHWEVCEKCNEVKENSTVAHTYEDGVCVCGANEQIQDTSCEHEYEYAKNATNHWKVCEKCNEVKENSTVAHTYEDGVCVCGANEQIQDTPCEHKYKYGKDNKKHWQVCKVCGEVKEGTTKNHTYDKYVDNKDGTHSATCTACKYELKEEHKTEGHCPLCEETANKPDNEKEDDKNSGNKEDNTVIDKEIPYTGAKGIVIFAIFAIAIAGAISAVKMKKYKGI